MSNTPETKFKRKSLTYGTSFKNEDTQEYMQLKLEDNLVILTIGELKKTGKGDYVRLDESALEAKFGAMNLHLLLDVYEECYADYENDKKFEAEAVVSGMLGNQLVQISDGSNINRPYGLYVTIYKDANIDEDFKNCKHRTYKLTTKKTIVGFNMGNGHKTKERKIEAKIFRKQLASYAETALGGIQHAVKEATKYDTDRIYRGIISLCAAQGISFVGERTAGGKPVGTHRMLIDNNAAPETYAIPDVKASAVDAEFYDLVL